MNWGAVDQSVREGSVVRRSSVPGKTSFMRNGVSETVEFIRKKWIVEPAPRFSEVDLWDMVNV